MTVIPLPDHMVVTRETRPVLLRHGSSSINFDLDECLTNACGRATCPCRSAPSLLDLCRGRLTVLEIAAFLAQCSSAPISNILANIVPELQSLADVGEVRAVSTPARNIDHEKMRPF